MHINEWLIPQQAQLQQLYLQALREIMFANRPELRPVMLRQVAKEVFEWLVEYCNQPNHATALEHGKRLSSLGLGDQSVLRLGQITRQFFQVFPTEQRLSALEISEEYHSDLLQGFMSAQRQLILEEQERIRSALQRTLTRYAVQITLAANLARAATSILDLQTLLQSTTELIHERFNLYYVGIFLVDTSKRWVVLQASAGEPGQVTMRRGQRLRIGGDSLVGQSVALGEPQIALDVGEKAAKFNTPLIADIHSEMAVPLISRSKIIGTILIQSHQVAAFSEQDVAVMSIVADQLANAIENARLYEQLHQELFEREHTANELRQAKETAELANRAKSTFLATMSHELRTPLTAIIGYSELLQREAEMIGHPDMIEDLNKIHMAGNHLLALINDVLDLSKIEAGKMRLYLESFSIDEIINDVVTTIMPLVEKNANTIIIETASNVGIMHADLTKVRQTLFNLLSNAAKFTEHGNITLKTERQHTDDGDWIYFEVKDDGIGISNEQMLRLFREFTQADASTTRRHGGTGLGLALSRRFCQIMGGEITATSIFGQGSVFAIRLPAIVPNHLVEALSSENSPIDPLYPDFS